MNGRASKDWDAMLCEQPEHHSRDEGVWAC